MNPRPKPMSQKRLRLYTTVVEPGKTPPEEVTASYNPPMTHPEKYPL